MAVDLSRMAFGRDPEVIRQTKNAITNAYQELDHLLSPVTYGYIMKVIDDNWSGSDAVRYKKVIEQDIADLKKIVDSNYKKIIEILDSAYHDFIAFQDFQAGN